MQEDKPIIQFGKILRYIIVAFSIGIVLFLLWYFSTIALSIILGVIFSLVGRPIFKALGKIKIRGKDLPDSIKAIFSLAAIWIVFLGFVAALVPMLVKEVNNISKIDPDKIMQGMEEPIDNTVRFLEKNGLMDYILNDTTLAASPPATGSAPKEVIISHPIIDTLIKNDSTIWIIHEKIIPPGDSLHHRTLGDVSNMEDDNTNDPFEKTLDSLKHAANIQAVKQMAEDKLVQLFNFRKVTGMFTSVFTLFSNVFIAVFSVTFIAFFFLKDKSLFANMVLSLTPERYERQAIIIMDESQKMLSRYFIGLGLELLGVMIMTGVGLLIIGFEFKTAVTIGFFCGFFNVIPYVGPILGGAFGIILGITTHLGMDVQTELFPLVLKMLAVFSVTQFIDNWFLQPYIFSNSVNAHPLEIFLVILLAGTLAGIPGMIFAVPGYSFLRIIARQFFNNFKIVRSLTKNM